MEAAQESYDRIAAILKKRRAAALVAEGMEEKEAAKKAEKLAIEDARFVLPNACDTKMIVTMNARSLYNFFAHRCCNRAQWEIREVADQMLALVSAVAPTLFSERGAVLLPRRLPRGQDELWKAAGGARAHREARAGDGRDRQADRHRRAGRLGQADAGKARSATGCAGENVPVRAVSFPDYARAVVGARQDVPCRANSDRPTDDADPYAASSFYAVDRYASYQRFWKADYHFGADLLLPTATRPPMLIHQMSKLPPDEWPAFHAWMEDFEYGKLGLPASRRGRLPGHASRRFAGAAVGPLPRGRVEAGHPRGEFRLYAAVPRLRALRRRTLRLAGGALLGRAPRLPGRGDRRGGPAGGQPNRKVLISYAGFQKNHPCGQGMDRPAAPDGEPEGQRIHLYQQFHLPHDLPHRGRADERLLPRAAPTGRAARTPTSTRRAAATSGRPSTRSSRTRRSSGSPST